MVRWVDCRKCKHFIPVRDMTSAMKHEARIWIIGHRPNSQLLGYCRYWHRSVTYYTGPCSGYEAKQTTQPKKLQEYLR